jgi:hypothetical protein
MPRTSARHRIGRPRCPSRRLLRLAGDQRDILIGRKAPADILAIEAISAALNQRVDVGQVAAIAKVQFHQALLHLGGLPCLGPVDQPGGSLSC